ncbi:MMS19 nucleotide excision repair protein homolog [Aricia agestis]|uniref:MMS19 nucleotide excision repair protein homolog n=1 Tax=Aricia agestis TaxID=91739 RepID=UPI001C20675E|nr:MMS19 nucleotide excision repair protein homolog [Aricia agestis]
MDSIWFKPELADEIMKSETIFQETNNIISDIMRGRIDITNIVENMAGVLTNKEPELREKGMRFFTKLLKEIPKDYLTAMQLKFISKFYIDRLKDNHRVIPPVLEGYLRIMEMDNYDVQSCGEYFSVLFREVPCQSQVRQDRSNIYSTLQKLMDRDVEYMKTLGPDFLYGVISAMDGERDPRNLLFLFNFLPKFLSHIPIGHLVEEMFEVISCYYPIDFHPSPNDPAPVTRDNLAAALCPCLCAIPEFGEQCLMLLVEKLDSNLRIAKLDSLKLLAESCKTFKAESYTPFLKTLWSSINREITHKTDDEIRMAAHEALQALVAKLATTANTDQAFENFLKGILISLQTVIADSNTVMQFLQASKVLLTVANSSKESCVIITKSMIPAVLAYYEFKTSAKLQTASLDFLGDLYELVKHWDVLEEVAQAQEIPQLCLNAASVPSKDHQIAGFKTLIRVKDVLNMDLVVPFVEILIYNIQNSNDDELLKYSVETIHSIAKRYPEIIMNLVVKGKCDLDNLMEDKVTLQKRLNLLTSLASLNDFTKMIISEILRLITTNVEEAPIAVKALNNSLSDTSLYTEEKLVQIESDHGLIDSILSWLLKDLNGPQESLSQGYELISSTIASLPEEKQTNILSKHTDMLLDKTCMSENYFLILQSLYTSVHQNVWNKYMDGIINLSLNLALNSENCTVRQKSYYLIAHALNKAEHGTKFEVLYEMIKSYLKDCTKDERLCPRLIYLYGFVTKALVMRGSEHFKFWLQKITLSILDPIYCSHGAEAIHTIMSDSTECLNVRHHCRTSLFYRQRVFQSFAGLMDKQTLSVDAKETYYLSWAYVIGGTPKTVINSEISKIAPLLIDALDFDNKDLLIVMMDVLIHFVQAKHVTIAQSLQTILPRLVRLSTYVKSMDVRIKSLQCLYEIASTYQTVLLLPYKRDVLLDLAPSLDDKKRLVRNAAVKARTRWFLVGSPGENKED